MEGNESDSGRRIFDLKGIKVFFFAGDGPDANPVIGMRNKCMIEIPKGGKPTLERMIDAFVSCGADDIYLVGDREELSSHFSSRDYGYVDSNGLMSTKIMKVINDFSFGDDEFIMAVPGDTPMITPESIDSFISSCDLDDADYFTAIVPREYIDMFSIYFDRNFFFTREVDARVSCLNLLCPGRMDFSHVQEMSDYRKMDVDDPDFSGKAKKRGLFPTLVRAIGAKGAMSIGLMRLGSMLYRTRYNNMQRLIKGLVSIDSLEEYAGKVFDARVQGVMIPYAEVTLDIDSDRDAVSFRNNYSGIMDTIKREHEIIDFMREYSDLIKGIDSDRGIRHCDKALALYNELCSVRVEEKFFDILKKDFAAFRRLAKIYSKKGPKAYGLYRDDYP